MARLKVFGRSDGLKTYVVAISSRPKALEVWGVHHDLFKGGVAREVEQEEKALTLELADARDALANQLVEAKRGR